MSHKSIFQEILKSEKKRQDEYYQSLLNNPKFIIKEENETKNENYSSSLHFPILEKNTIKHTNKPTEAFNSKTISIALNDEYTPELNKLHLKSYLFTANFDPSTSYSKAWEVVTTIKNSIIEELVSSSLTHLISSTIEHHHEENKEHKIRDIYRIKNMKDLEKLYYEAPDLRIYIKTIDKSKLTEFYLNIITELIYMTSLNPRDPEFVQLLYVEQKKLTKLVDFGNTYNFQTKLDENKNEYYCKSLPLFLAFTQEKYKAVMIGYPHIHMCILCDASSNFMDLRRQLLEICKIGIKKSNSSVNLCDLTLNPGKGDPPNVAYPFTYVFKNHSSETVKNSLEWYSPEYNWVNKNEPKPEVLFIVESYITSINHFDFLYNMLSRISNPKYKFISNIKCKRTETIPMCIFDARIKSQIPITPNPKDEILFVDPERNKGKNRYLYAIQKYMADNNYSICRGMIYKKREESKTSWLPVSSIEDFIESTTLNIEYNTAQKTNIIQWMKIETSHNIGGEEIWFPRININYRIIEFKDFYFSLVTRRIYKTQNIYQTYIFCPEINLTNYNNLIRSLIDKSIWIKTLTASGLFTIDDIAILYKSVLTRENGKNENPSLTGPSNTGKTEIITPYVYVFPSHLVGYLKEITDFHLFYQVAGKEMVVVNESNGVFRGVTTKNRADTLLFLEGGIGNINEKHGNISKYDFSKTGVIYTSNIECEDEEVYLNQPLVNRLQICLTKRANNDIIVQKYTNIAAKYESPLIILFSAMCSMAFIYNLQTIPNLIVHETLEGDELEKIKISDIKITEEEISRKEGDDILRYSEKLINKVTEPINFTNFTHEILPHRSKISQKEKVMIIKHIIRDLKIDDLKNKSNLKNDAYEEIKKERENDDKNSDFSKSTRDHNPLFKGVDINNDDLKNEYYKQYKDNNIFT